MKMFDYYDLFLEKGATKIEDLSDNQVDSKQFMIDFNNESLKKSIYL